MISHRRHTTTPQSGTSSVDHRQQPDVEKLFDNDR
jgi:hypothetical protein